MLRSSKPQPLKIVVLGEAQVGKTCFIDMFLQGKHYIRHPAVDSELLSRTISHQNENWDLCFMDVDPNVSLGPRYQNMVDGYLETAHGIIFMYDITQGYSFDNVIAEPYLHTWYCRNTVFNKHPVTRKLVGSKKRFGCVLVGNKTDVVSEDATKRQVHTGTAEQWAASQGMRHFEVTANERGEVEAVVQALIDSILRARRMDARDAGARVKPSRASSNDSDARSVMSLFKRATKR